MTAVRGKSVQVCHLSPSIYKMSSLNIFLLSSALVLLTVVSSQEYFVQEYDREHDAGTSRDAGELSNDELIENARFRRDDEVARHRRQGGHGNGGGGGGGHEGITGPVHTFVKTDEHAHFKWGVRHHVGHEYAGRR